MCVYSIQPSPLHPHFVLSQRQAIVVFFHTLKDNFVLATAEQNFRNQFYRVTYFKKEFLLTLIILEDFEYANSQDPRVHSFLYDLLKWTRFNI